MSTTRILNVRGHGVAVDRDDYEQKQIDDAEVEDAIEKHETATSSVDVQIVAFWKERVERLNNPESDSSAFNRARGIWGHHRTTAALLSVSKYAQLESRLAGPKLKSYLKARGVLP